MSRPVVLDTHVWVWLMFGEDRLGRNARRTIEAAVPDGCLRVSVISAWEVAMLEQKGRLNLGDDCETWVRNALAAPGTRLAEVTPHIAVCSTRLPGAFHGDPADRMLVATARECDAVFLTADREVLRYAAEGHVRAVSAEL